MRIFFNSPKLSNYVHQNDAIPLLTVIGIFIGISTGLFLLLFKFAIDYPLIYFLGSSENYESLDSLKRFILTFTGSILIALIWYKLPVQARAVGVPHVLEKIQHDGGRLPAINLFSQFIGGSLSLLTGQSVGREGPTIHLGAGLASILGQKLNLPNHSIQILLGCGVAGAIAAFFNTPLAGVIFAMEVILVKYSISWAVPIMASAFTASLLSQGLWSGDISFTNPDAHLNSLLEIPFLIVIGFLVGTSAALFNFLIRFGLRFRHYSVLLRLPIAGLITASVAVFIPEVMGTGYDTISNSIQNNYGFQVLLFIFLAKIFVTGCSIGLGMPAGLIGPTLVIGGSLGGLSALAISSFNIGLQPDSSLYVLIATSAMMSAVLQAPIAALMTVLEFSSNTEILFPAMITIIVANLTCKSFFKQPSIFISILQTQGMSLVSSPVTRALREMDSLEYGLPAESIITGSMTADIFSELIDKKPYITISHNQKMYALESQYATQLLDQEISKSTTENNLADILIDPTTWVDDQNELIWLPSHSTLEQVLRNLQGRNVAGVRLSDSENQLPQAILPKKFLLELITKIGE